MGSLALPVKFQVRKSDRGLKTVSNLAGAWEC